MRSSRRWLLGALLTLLLTAGAIPYLPAPFAIRPAHATITHVGTDTYFHTASNTGPITVTIQQQPSAGNALVICITGGGASWGDLSTISGAGITTYTAVNVDLATNKWDQVYVGYNASGSGGTSLSIVPNGSNSNTGNVVSIAVAEFSGLAGTSDGNGHNAGNAGTQPATASLVTTNAADLLIVTTGDSASDTLTLSGGSWTAFGSLAAGADGVALGAAFQIVAATGTYSESWTGASGAWDSQIVGLKATATVAVPSNSPDTLPLLGVGNGGRGGGGISQPPGNQAGTRDPALQPCATNSPWNYPIGTGATYATVNRGDGGTGFGGINVNAGSFTIAIYIAQSSDPSGSIIRGDRTSSGGSTFVYGTNTFGRHIPSGAVPSPGSDAQMSVITPDHLTSMDFHVSSQSGSTYNAFAGADNLDLKGPCHNDNSPADVSIWHNSGDEATPAPNSPNNVDGSVFDSDGVTTEGGMPQVAGMIRSGEFANGIPHALAIATNSSYLNPGFVWPDSSTGSGNRGSNANITMGSLLAVQTSFSCATLNTTQGINLCKAFENYGAYIRDAGGVTNAIIIYVDYVARNDVPNSGSFTTDLNTIASNLRVITNSNHNGGAPVTGIKIDGGDGTVNSALIAATFDAAYGGGNGRTSYFRPFIPWARLAKAFPMFRLH